MELISSISESVCTSVMRSQG